MDAVARLALKRPPRNFEKKLPPLAAGTAAILVCRIAEAGTGPAKYMEQREGVSRFLMRSGLQITFVPPVRLVGSAGGVG